MMNIIFLIGPFAILLLLLVHNILAAQYNCFNTSDLGIYTQALYELANWKNFNPFLSVRGLAIFNDHFDPILVLVAPLTRLLNYHINGPILIEILWMMATMMTLIITLKVKSLKRTASEIGFYLLLLLTSKGLISALVFPIHPTTWSVFPCLLLVLAFYQQQNQQQNQNQHSALRLGLAAIFLCLFREDFPFAILGLALSYIPQMFIYDRAEKINLRNKFLVLLAVSAAIIYFDFFLRPKLLGTITPYGNGLLHLFVSAPFQVILTYLQRLKWGVISIYIPFLMPFTYVIFKEIIEKEKEKEKGSPQFSGLAIISNFIAHPVWNLIGFLTPLLLIRLLANAFAFHYSAPIVVSMITFLSLSPSIHKLWTSHQVQENHEDSKKDENKKRIITLWLLFLPFIATSSSLYTKVVKLVFFKSSSKCLISNEKKMATQDLLSKLASTDPHLPLMATGGIIPQILRPGANYYHYGSLGLPVAYYDYLLFELNGSGDSWPFTAEQVALALKRCRPYAREVMQESQFYALWAGKFPEACFKTETLQGHHVEANH